MTKRNIKISLLKLPRSAIVPVRKIAELAMQELKKIWQNWNWVLPVGALAISIFTWVYKVTDTPARIAELEDKLVLHMNEAENRIKKIESDYNDVKLTLTELKAMMNISLQDLAIMKGYITGEAHHK